MSGRSGAGRGWSWGGWLPWVALGALLLGLLVWSVWPSDPPTDRERVRSLAAQLRCPDCESLSAADSSTASARAIRRDLAARVAAGESDGDIRRAYADRYGESILLEPDRDGLGLVLWVLPIVVVAGGVAGLVVAFRRWRTGEPLRATPDDEALVRESRDRGTG